MPRDDAVIPAYPARGRCRAPATTRALAPSSRAAAGRGRQRAVSAAATALLALAAPLSALAGQTPQTVASGTFEWRRDGRTVATETFEIRKTGRELRAVGRVSADSSVAGLRPLRVWLETDADYAPGLFRLRPSAGDIESVTAVREENRLRLQMSSAAGDRWKEFLGEPGLSLLEPGVAHHWIAVLRQHRSGLEEDGAVEVPAVVPSERRRATLRIERHGTERVEVPGEDRPAVRYTATLSSGEEFRIWATEEGRLLRVDVPARGLTAVRLPGS